MSVKRRTPRARASRVRHLTSTDAPAISPFLAAMSPEDARKADPNMVEGLEKFFYQRFLPFVPEGYALVYISDVTSENWGEVARQVEFQEAEKANISKANREAAGREIATGIARQHSPRRPTPA